MDLCTKILRWSTMSRQMYFFETTLKLKVNEKLKTSLQKGLLALFRFVFVFWPSLNTVLGESSPFQFFVVSKTEFWGSERINEGLLNIGPIISYSPHHALSLKLFWVTYWPLINFMQISLCLFLFTDLLQRNSLKIFILITYSIFILQLQKFQRILRRKNWV